MEVEKETKREFSLFRPLDRRRSFDVDDLRAHVGESDSKRDP